MTRTGAITNFDAASLMCIADAKTLFAKSPLLGTGKIGFRDGSCRIDIGIS
jgi:hypothetical protein